MKKIGAFLTALLLAVTAYGSTVMLTAAPAGYQAGVYTAAGKGNNGDVTVEVTLSSNKITGVKVLEHKETPGLCETALERIPATIVNEQTLAVDTVSGATNTSNAILQAVEACIVKAGGDVGSLKAEREKQTSSAVQELSADVVVVGAGAAGSAAALAASQEGAKVILLEKSASVGGAGTMAGVLFADHSSLQIAQGKEVDTQWLYDQYINDSSYYANARLVSAIIGKSASTVDWLLGNGVNLTLLDAGQGSQYAHVGMPTTAHGYTDGGKIAIETLIEKMKKLGGEVYFETTGEELIMDANGMVSGVAARKADGSVLRIHAKSVVLATGGYGGNAEMMKEQFGDSAGVGLVATATGDGIRMAWSAGAAECGTEVAQWFGMKYGPEARAMKDSGALTEIVRNPLLFVNNEGKRFGNEESAYESAALGTMMYTQPDSEMIIILDQGIVNSVTENGLAEIFGDRWGHLYGQGVSYIEGGSRKILDEMCERNRAPINYTPTLEDAVTCGVAVKANTVEELAQLLDTPALTQEISTYNQMCKNGEDTLHHKNAKYLTALETGPYYGIRVKLRCLGTLGGVRIDENIQAVNAENKPIQNLWVAGADAGGMYGNNYVMFEGGTLGFAYNSGRIAGENAAQNAK